MISVALIGGPFDGGTLEVPRRTPAGLLLTLNDGPLTGDYRLTREPGSPLTASFCPARVRLPVRS